LHIWSSTFCQRSRKLTESCLSFIDFQLVYTLTSITGTDARPPEWLFHYFQVSVLQSLPSFSIRSKRSFTQVHVAVIILHGSASSSTPDIAFALLALNGTSRIRGFHFPTVLYSRLVMCIKRTWPEGMEWATLQSDDGWECLLQGTPWKKKGPEEVE
jgi:hypothetical protein